MDLVFYGGAKEVGRCCIEVIFNDRRILLDSGVKISKNNLEFPLSIPNMNYIQNVFLSHVHLDHTGALPLFYNQGMRCAIYCTEMTKKILPTLLKDSWKISMIEERVVGYKKSDINEILKLVIAVKENKNHVSEFKIAGGNVKLFDAGHIPGSRALFFDFGDETLMYTGDISLTQTLLTNPADIEHFPECDVLLIESTYGNREHQDRDKEKESFFRMIDDILAQGGTVLVPTFAIGRSQEILMMLYQRGYFSKVPVFLDGMSRKLTKDIIAVTRNILLKESYENVTLVDFQKKRSDIVKKSCIVVTTSGMLDGGPVLEYLKNLNSNDGILLTGYQAKSTNGDMLMKTGFVEIDEKRIKIKSKYKKFDFSSHAGFSDLIKIIKAVSPKNVVLVHGEEDSMKNLSEHVNNLGIKVYLPKQGERIHIAKIT